MDLYVIDFETYYSKEYSLSGMTTAEYVLHENFEVILVGIRYPDGRKEWITGTHAEIQHFFNGIDFSNAAILCHHTLFDGAILAWHFNVRPKRWLDTLCMARAMFGNKGNSLKALAEKFNLPAKGEEVHTMLGRRRLSLSKIELEKYAGYCLNDVEITYQLFQILAEGWYDPETLDKRDPFPKDEYKLIDLTIRMFTEPVLRLNPTKLNSHLTAVKDRKAALLSAVGIDRGELLSNDKFAKQLIAFGVVPPTKISPTTGKETYAFAKTDPGLKELQEHDDERVQALVAARLGVKSTLEETRTERLLVVAGLTPKHKMPVPLTYCAAHTKRYGGADKINLQNLPSRGANAGELKDCIEAPEGWELGDCDSSNIEARMLAWWAMQDDLVADFANGVDVYSKMASKIYGRHVDRKKVEGDKEAGFVGKTVVLGCGYQTGANKLQATLKAATPSMDMPIEWCEEVIKTYRASVPKIKALWYQAEKALEAIHSNQFMWLGRPGVVAVEGKKGIRLPSGLYLSYPQLHKNKDGDWEYKSDKGMTKIYGGKVVENCTQALARIVVGVQMLKITERLKVALTVHDSVIAVFKKEQRDEAARYIVECMRYVPDWAKGCPFNCEIKVGPSYGSVKELKV